MINSALLKSSIAKKYWMALTGLFLCTFLLGHLLGNFQLLVPGEEGRRMFNEYAYFMTHNPAIKVLSYLTYISIIFHAIDGIVLTIQNKKARPVAYAYNNPSANSSTPARYMAILGTLILVFIATHMANFWWKMKFTNEIPLHTYKLESKQEMGASADQTFYYTQTPSLQPIPADPNSIDVKNKTELYYKGTNIKIGEGYKDLHTVVMTFFRDSSTGLVAVIFYVFSMLILGFHLWHGFASGFQSLGVNHPKWNSLIKTIGKGFAVLVPFAFAIIPIIIFLNK